MHHQTVYFFDSFVCLVKVRKGVVTVDWVHTVLCDGAFSCECHLLLKRSQDKIGKGFEHVAAFLQDGWAFPAHRRIAMRAIHRVFNDFRHVHSENHDRLKATASELLCVYGMLRHWVRLELSAEDSMTEEVHSFNACCEVVDIMLRTKQGKISMPEGARSLRAATASFLTIHQRCYGSEHMKPKHHWLFDIAEQWLLHELVVDAFLIEKEHLLAKPIADRTDNTSTFETSVLAGMLNSQVKSLLDIGPQAEILGRSSPYPGFDSLVSDNVAIDGVTFSVGDLVCCNAKPGKVVACVQEEDDFFLVIDALALSARLSRHSAIYAFDGRRVVWDARKVSLALAWRSDPRGVVVILC